MATCPENNTDPLRPADVILPECVVKAPCPDPESGVPAAYRGLDWLPILKFSTSKNNLISLCLLCFDIFRCFFEVSHEHCAWCGKPQRFTPCIDFTCVALCPCTVDRIISCFSPLLSDLTSEPCCLPKCHTDTLLQFNIVLAKSPWFDRSIIIQNQKMGHGHPCSIANS